MSKDFVAKCVEKHNELRAIHGAQPLRISSSLNDSAQRWADHLIAINSFQHSQAGNSRPANVGENLYSSWSSNPSAKPDPTKAPQSWYDEITEDVLQSLKI